MHPLDYYKNQGVGEKKQAAGMKLGSEVGRKLALLLPFSSPVVVVG